MTMATRKIGFGAAGLLAMSLMGALPVAVMPLSQAQTATITSAVATPDEATTQTAVFLLQTAVSPQRNGQHNILLRSLRQLHDPTLAPLFAHLMSQSSPSLQIHGFLGAAESDPKGQLNLTHLATVKDPRLQAEMLSAALDTDLLSVDQAKAAITWPDLDVTVRLLVAVRLTQAGAFDDRALPLKATTDENPARRGLAGLTLLQLDDPEGLKTLAALDAGNDPRRDEVREMVLQTALRFEFDKVGPWALTVSQQPNVNSRVGLLALRAALRFGVPGAAAQWRRMYEADADLSQRTRLGFIALNLANWLQPDIFAPLEKSDDATLKQIGVTGRAIAAKGDAAPAIGQLIALQHPVASAWALAFARRTQDLPAAKAAALAVIDVFPGPARNQAQRFDDANNATQLLYDRDPKAAIAELQKRLTDPKTDDLQRQAMLLGLLRVTQGSPQDVIAGLPAFANPGVQGLALLLRAKNGADLTAKELDDLALLVRGGGGLPDALRLQAAWNYLRRTGQMQVALTEVLRKQ